jgi:hypothetical protein
LYCQTIVRNVNNTQLQTVKVLGLDMPATLPALADEVIE